MQESVKLWCTTALAAACAAVALLVALACMLPTTAQALDCNKTAYNRAVKAAYAYKSEPRTYMVDVSDLKLTRKQVNAVVQEMHVNGELFWVNTWAVDTTSTTMTFTQPYSDAKVDKMRAQVNKEVAKAKKRLGNNMPQATKVHMLHDWFIKHVSYAKGKKDAYTSLVEGKGDCFGFALGFDLLLRRAGFSTDMALNDKIDHSWNLVKVSGTWYHVDTTWDKSYSYRYGWKNEICHEYLLQSDWAMNLDTHRGWTVSYKCPSKKYWSASEQGGYFARHCKAYKSIVNSFTVAGFHYKVLGPGRVSLSGLSATVRRRRTLTLPKTVKHKKGSYKVCGIRTRALSGARARTFVVASTGLSKVRVKGSLSGSKVTTVKVKVGSKSACRKYAKRYAKYFTMVNAGRSVKVQS